MLKNRVIVEIDQLNGINGDIEFELKHKDTSDDYVIFEKIPFYLGCLIVFIIFCQMIATSPYN